MTGAHTQQLAAHLFGQAHRVQVLAQGVAPVRQAPPGVEQLQVTHAGVVVLTQLQFSAVVPALPCVLTGLASHEPAVSRDQQSPAKAQPVVKVNTARTFSSGCNCKRISARRSEARSLKDNRAAGGVKRVMETRVWVRIC